MATETTTIEAGGKKKTFMVSRDTTRSVKCVLTNDELLDIAQQLAEAQSQAGKSQNELDAFKKQKQAEIARHEATIAECGGLLRSKFQYREVACTEDRNFLEKRLRVTRSDTREVVEDRPLRDHELQSEHPDLVPPKEGS